MTQANEPQPNRPTEPHGGLGPSTDPAPTERTRFLVRMLEDQEHDRLAPVERYVEEFSRIEDFVRAEHANLARQSVGGSTALLAQDLRSGDRVGRYELIRVIGEGGMGRAWLARDPQLSRAVVVKALRGDAEPNDPGHDRLRREARVLGKLEHPGIAKVLDILEEGSRVYLVLPFYDGDTLASRIARARARSELDLVSAAPWVDIDGAPTTDRPTTLRALLEYFARVADALHTAHQGGVVHRDLKPQNLIVQADGSPVVLDFGLALPSADDRLTQPGEVIGTPLYMSPEQVDGSRPVDERSDIYSLSVTLYECLTMVHPFAGDGGREATFHRVLRGDPVPLRRHQSLIPRDLEAVVQKGMERDPQRRYRDAAALARELRRVIELEPTEARPMSGITLWVRRATRRPRRFAAAAMTMSMISIAGWMTWDAAEVRDRVMQNLAEERQGLVDREAETLTTGLVLDWCDFVEKERGILGDAVALQDLDALEQQCIAMQPPLGVLRVLLLRGSIADEKGADAQREVLRRYERTLRRWPDEPRKAWAAFAAARWAVHHAGDDAEGESFANLGIALVEQFALRGTWTKLESMEIATDPEFWVAERSRPQAAGVDDSRGCGLLLRAQARKKLGRAGDAMADLDAAISLLDAVGNVHRLANALALRAELRVAAGDTEAALVDAARAMALYEAGFTDPTPDNRNRPGAPEVRVRDRQGADSMRKLEARAHMANAQWGKARQILEGIEQDRTGDRMSLVNCDVPLLLAECLLRDPAAASLRSRAVREQLERGRLFWQPRDMRPRLAAALRLEAELVRGEGAMRAAADLEQFADQLEAQK